MANGSPFGDGPAFAASYQRMIAEAVTEAVLDQMGLIPDPVTLALRDVLPPVSAPML